MLVLAQAILSFEKISYSSQNLKVSNVKMQGDQTTLVYIFVKFYNVGCRGQPTTASGSLEGLSSKGIQECFKVQGHVPTIRTKVYIFR